MSILLEADICRLVINLNMDGRPRTCADAFLAPLSQMRRQRRAETSPHVKLAFALTQTKWTFIRRKQLARSQLARSQLAHSKQERPNMKGLHALMSIHFGRLRSTYWAAPP